MSQGKPLLYSHRPLLSEEMAEMARGVAPGQDVVVLNAGCHPGHGLRAAVEDAGGGGGRAVGVTCAACGAAVVAVATADRAELKECPCGSDRSLAAYVVSPPSLAVTCAGCKSHQVLPVRSGRLVGGDEPPAFVHEPPRDRN